MLYYTLYLQLYIFIYYYIMIDTSYLYNLESRIYTWAHGTCTYDGKATQWDRYEIKSTQNSSIFFIYVCESVHLALFSIF